MNRELLIKQIRESQEFLKAVSDKYDKLAEVAINSTNIWYVSTVASLGINAARMLNKAATDLMNTLSQENPPKGTL